MEKIKITCDSTCDLTPALYEKYQIGVIPLGVSLGDDFHKDGVDVSALEVFEFVEKTGVLPKTSAVSIGEYEEFFKKFTDEGYTVIHVNISSKFSSCYQNACLAAKEYPGVFPIDSKNLSSGSGHLALEGADLAQKGLSAEEIVKELEEMRERLDVSFVLQTLDYLKKGGRCSGIVALGANLLKLRPEIEVIEGGMKVGKKYRGKAETSIHDYVEGRLKGRTDLQYDRIFITHSNAPREIVEQTVKQVKELQPFAEVIETVAGCTVSSHCGPCCLGVLFFRKKED
jgi:DegV family protein with EDD domain